MRLSPPPLPEYCCPDAHAGRAGRHRRFEIVRHAHRERVELDALFAQLPRTVCELCEQLPLRLEAFARRRDAHQTAQLQARQLPHSTRERRELRLGYSALAGLIDETHLDADVERRRVRAALLAQAHSDAL